MPNTYAARRFREGKFTALSHLMRVLEAEELPRERGHSFKAGQVEKYLGLESPLQPRTLLAVLRDAKVPHDNNCRFLPWMIYDYLPAFRKLHREYRSDLGMKLPQAKQETGPGAEETGTFGRGNRPGGWGGNRRRGSGGNQEWPLRNQGQARG